MTTDRSLAKFRDVTSEELYADLVAKHGKRIADLAFSGEPTPRKPSFMSGGQFAPEVGQTSGIQGKGKGYGAKVRGRTRR